MFEKKLLNVEKQTDFKFSIYIYILTLNFKYQNLKRLTPNFVDILLQPLNITYSYANQKYTDNKSREEHGFKNVQF